ncbi:MAG TPA: lipopolysaccharide assembly protein LapA domain-containing protein [Novosphingobium sp.]|nr:lipopolysaccharide assembly protein LapA domain-containing protein [Novosphingobium sp.]
MTALRTIFWVLLAVVLVLFAINNWQPVEVRVWSTLVLETKLAALAIAAFLLGLVPMWLVHRAAKWRLRRRIAQLESSLGMQALPPPLPPPPPPA